MLTYHSDNHTPEGYMYYACAALFDLKNPMKLIARLKEPLFSPTEKWERKAM
ncbi:MAG: hypothetical protein JJE44_04925 [Flavobacteriaceae bacterium]|nr:hypothetical protein [Flavobacteriaceae bacterium]